MGQHSNDDDLCYSYGNRAGEPIGADQNFGPSGSIRPRLNDGPRVSGPNANFVNLARSMPSAALEVSWQTKSRARVFDVDSSQYDSSQFVGIPRLSEFYASDFSDATEYDSNFNSTDSYVPLLVGSTFWCPDLGVTHHVCQNASNLHTSSPYTGHSDTENLNGGQVRDELHHFSADSVVPYLSTHTTALQDSSMGVDIFSLWHKRLGHPSPAIVKIVLDKC
ncbi:hypothetical protein ERO13_A07G060050v2 [Gossypium hirsutum]|nr:hypothetical protein ERO13_A07G060050v2 [Gossypium hirsutum]